MFLERDMKETIINIIEQCCETDNSYLFDFILTLLASGIAFGTTLYFDRRVKRREQKKEKKNQKEEKQREKERFEKELKDRLDYLTKLIDSAEKTVSQQIGKCEEFIQTIEKNPYELHHVKIIASNDIRRILALDAQSTFFAYRYFFKDRINWLKEYSEFNSGLDFIDGTLDEIKRIYFSNKDFVLSNQFEYKKIVEDLRSYIYRLLKSFENELPDFNSDSRYTFLAQLFRKFEELAEASANLTNFDNEFLTPLKNGIDNEFDKERYAAIVTDMVSRAKMKLNDMQVENMETAGQFKIIVTELTNCLPTLRETRERIENSAR